MPEGPNKSEELLQRYSKQRREQSGDFSLHPATRRLLQGEVAREFGARSKEKRNWLTWIGLWRGRLAFAGGVAALVITGLLIFRNERGHQAMQLADAKISEKRGYVSRDANVVQSEPEAFGEEKSGASVLAAGRRKLVEPPVALRLEREVASSSVASPETQARQKLSAGLPALGVNAPVNSDPIDGFAGYSFFSITNTNAPVALAYSDAYTLSLAPVMNTWDVATGQTNKVAASMYAFEISPQARFARTGAAAAGANALSFGTSITNSVSLADGDHFYRVPASTPLLVAKDAGSETRLELGTSEAVKNEAVPAQRLDKMQTPARASQFRGDNSSIVAQSTANKPALAAPRASLAAEFKSKVEDLDTIAAIAPDLPGSAASNTALRFFRLAQTTLDENLSRAPSENALKKESAQHPALPVLDHFTLEQRGQTVRVIDADGSLYEGYIEPPVTFEDGRDKNLAEKETVKEDLRQGIAGLNERQLNRGQEFSFRASGSNVTLQQLVIVSGKLTQTTNGAPSDRGAGAGFFGNGIAPATGGTVSQRDLGRQMGFGGRAGGGAATNSLMSIEGTLRIGRTNLQWFKAVPEPR